jgi:hypothetical protein
MPATGPYKMLSVMEDGTAYYETGQHQHLLPDKVQIKTEGFINKDALNSIISAIQSLPFDAERHFDATTKSIPAATGFPSTHGYLKYFISQDSSLSGAIKTNYDPLTANVSMYKDIPAAVLDIFAQLKTALLEGGVIM